MAQPSDAIDQSTYLRITCEAEFAENITADGDYEISFGDKATVALTPDAAEKFFSMLNARLPELRELADKLFA
ncbi:MAG: hypothetical protein HOV94_43900 [Saccharothrix sp.]|nr:hypothetical protein [Saccharothrix sp.]